MLIKIELKHWNVKKQRKFHYRLKDIMLGHVIRIK